MSRQGKFRVSMHNNGGSVGPIYIYAKWEDEEKKIQSSKRKEEKKIQGSTFHFPHLYYHFYNCFLSTNPMVLCHVTLHRWSFQRLLYNVVLVYSFPAAPSPRIRIRCAQAHRMSPLPRLQHQLARMTATATTLFYEMGFLFYFGFYWKTH